MSEHDLRRKAQRLTDLRRRHEAHDPLSDEEMAELQRGIPAEEMREIINAIRGERRNARPSKKTKEVTDKREQETKRTKPIDVTKFFGDDNVVPIRKE